MTARHEVEGEEESGCRREGREKKEGRHREGLVCIAVLRHALPFFLCAYSEAWLSLCLLSVNSQDASM